MTIFFLIYLALIILSLRVNRDGHKLEKCLSQKRTSAINGMFVVMVFFSHFYSYYVDQSLTMIDSAPRKIISMVGQLMVTTFLFFSGYGIMYSIKNKKNYIDTFLKKRFLPTWINFAIAVAIFAIINLFLGISYTKKAYILAFTGYESIGNSNWYMLAIFALYIFSVASFKIFQKSSIKGIASVTLLCLLYIIWMQYAKGGGYWCDTILCYPLGMLVYHYKEPIEKILKNKKMSIVALSLAMIITIGAHFILGKIHSDTLHLIMSMSFCIMILFFGRWLYLESRILSFFGKYVFWIYILQRVPMILFAGKIEMHVCFVLCLLVTIMASMLLNAVMERLYGITIKKETKTKNVKRLDRAD